MSEEMNNNEHHDHEEHHEHHEENMEHGHFDGDGGDSFREEATPVTPEQFVSDELASAKKALAGTQIWGSIFVLAVACVLGGIGNGFASNLAPKEAAKITKGMIMQRLDGLQEQASTYLKEQIPSYIEQAPDWAMAQLPEYRNSLEEKLEEQFSSFAHETSGKLDTTFDTFIDENADDFKTIILNGQDKETTDAVAAHLRDSFMAYLTEPGEDGESVQDKFDKSLEMLQEIEQKTHWLAFGKGLNPTDLKTKRAVAVLFGTITENKDLMPIPSKEDVQGAVSSILPESAEQSAEGDTPSTGDDTPAASAPTPGKSKAAAKGKTVTPRSANQAAGHARAAVRPATDWSRKSTKAPTKLTSPAVVGSARGAGLDPEGARKQAVSNARSAVAGQGGTAKVQHVPNTGRHVED